MEIVIENPTSEASSNAVTNGSTTTSPVTPIFATVPTSHPRPYRTAYVTSDVQLMQNVDYYRTLPGTVVGQTRARDPSPEPVIYEANLPMETSLKRVDRSGLLGIVEDDTQCGMGRPRGPRSAETTGPSSLGSLPRRVDRSGLLEAVPELPDNCQSWKNDDTAMENDVGSSSSFELRNTAKEDVQRPQNPPILRSQTSPRGSSHESSRAQTSVKRLSMEVTRDESSASKSRENRSRAASPGDPTSSPYLRRYPSDRSTSSLERPTPVMIGNDQVPRTRDNSFTRLSPSPNKFLPIDAPPARSSRQSYVDLTGSPYTRSAAPIATTPSRARIETTSKYCETDSNKGNHQQPDCLGRLSPRSRNDGQSPLTMSSSIPDVIEAHGSRSRNREGPQSPEQPERAEAEGCEQRGHDDDTEDTRVTFKGAKKILHNDNIQTLRVIILSEQL